MHVDVSHPGRYFVGRPLARPKNQTYTNVLQNGVYTACLTPQLPDLAIDDARLAAHAAWLLDEGATGLALMGTTGEAVSFGVEERAAMLERVLEAGIPADRILLGVGCCALTDTVRLVRHALSHGVAQLLVLPPFYYKNVGDDGLCASFDALLARVGDERMRIYLYHFPRMSGVPFTQAAVERLVAAYPKTIAGIKDSSGDYQNMCAMVRAFPHLQIFAGTERFLLDLLQQGGAGCISATMNLTAGLARAVYDRRDSGEAGELQERLTALRGAIETHPMIPALKFLTEQRTGDEAWRHMRPPLTPLDSEARTSLLTSVRPLSSRLFPA